MPALHSEPDATSETTRSHSSTTTSPTETCWKQSSVKCAVMSRSKRWSMLDAVATLWARSLSSSCSEPTAPHTCRTTLTRLW